jgi:predicted N-formylglutamate amidohydrolase
MRDARPVLHISVHSFAPELDGKQRTADIGLLYDPDRGAERRFSRHWRQALKAVAPNLRVRLNYPYRGSADGHTTALRRRFTEAQYLGIELEVNQNLVVRDRNEWACLQKSVAETLISAIGRSTREACWR